MFRRNNHVGVLVLELAMHIYEHLQDGISQQHQNSP